MKFISFNFIVVILFYPLFVILVKRIGVSSVFVNEGKVDNEEVKMLFNVIMILGVFLEITIGLVSYL